MVVHNIEEQESCEYCGNKYFVESFGEKVCNTCGTVVDKIYRDSSYMIRENKDRAATQYTSIRKDSSGIEVNGHTLGTRYMNHRDANGKPLNPNVVSTYNRLIGTYQRYVKRASTQTHLRTFQIFNRVSTKLMIPQSLKERTSFLYWKYANHPDVDINNHVLLIALCLLIAVKEGSNKYPLRFQEVIGAFNKAGHRVNNKNIVNLAFQLNVKFNSSPLRRSEDYINRISNTIRNDETVNAKIARYDSLDIEVYEALLCRLSELLLDKIPVRNRGGIQPFGYSVAIVYLADRAIARYYKRNPLLTQKSIAKITGAREYTIRDHCYKSLSSIFDDNKDELHSYIYSFLKSR